MAVFQAKTAISLRKRAPNEQLSEQIRQRCNASQEHYPERTMSTAPVHTPPRISDSPSTLVAIAYGARRSGDTSIEQQARRELSAQYGITLRFAAVSDKRKAVAR